MNHFVQFPKMARLNKPIVITEKIDGTNAQVIITEEMEVLAGSRTRLITPGDDNFGFAAWVKDNEEELKLLGPGNHFGEWWGKGIQRGYGMDTRVFSLFNTDRWGDPVMRPGCCDVVPVLGGSEVPHDAIFNDCVIGLKGAGSLAAKNYGVTFMEPEGIVVFHTAANMCFKVPFEDAHKTQKKPKNKGQVGNKGDRRKELNYYGMPQAGEAGKVPIDRRKVEHIY